MMPKLDLRPVIGLLAAFALLGAPRLPTAQESTARPATSVEAVLAAAERERSSGNLEGEQAALEGALTLAGPSSAISFDIYERMRMNFADRGNFVRAIDAAEKQLQAPHRHGQAVGVLTNLVSLHAALYRMEDARRDLGELERLLQRLRSNPNWSRRGDWWQAQVARARAKYENRAGHLELAEQAFRTCLSMSTQALAMNPDKEGSAVFVDCGEGLLHVLIDSGRLDAAGVWADELRTSAAKTVDMTGRPAVMVRVWPGLARLAAEQGRLAHARQLYHRAISILQDAGAQESSLRLAALWWQLAVLDMVEGRWSSALQLHRQREAAIRAAGGDAGNIGAGSEEYAYTLLRVGAPAAAEQMLDRMIAKRDRLFDQNSVYYWDVRAFHGVVLAANGKKDEALKELRVAIPKMLDLIKGERSSSEAGVLRTARLNWLLDGYIGLLSDYAKDGDAAAMDEAFRMADIARASTVQRALAASASRARISDPALADLARREQDLQREISSLSDSIGNLLSRGRIAEQDGILAEMRAKLVALRREHSRAQAEIERRFPDYAALLNPKPVGITDLQKLLKPDEAVFAVYAGSERSAVWAIPGRGKPSFASVGLTREQLDLKAAALRSVLSPDAADKLPAFRFDISHELYSQLLMPVETGWKGARELIVIPHGRLGQLPLGVLTTEPFRPTPAKLEYAEMADAPWLIKQVAITQLPAAIAMPALRNQGAGQRAERAFIGFGDPVFMPAGAETVPQSGQRRGMQRRNLDIARSGHEPTSDVAPDSAQKIDFSLLPPLPDTALEIDEIAQVLAADQKRDVFLNRSASEAQVKKTDLSQYRVVMFATHGLMSGEMPGLYQPALAMSNPAVTGDGEDGMLTMEEILNLKLKAEWVVLSACNSAAGGDQNGESVSGLGRAFFYAGAKSLLVTNWAVETRSARMLTTEVFRRQAERPALSRATTLQQASLALMKQSAGRDFSYAHPMFWAPYTLVGDGG